MNELMGNLFLNGLVDEFIYVWTNGSMSAALQAS